MERTVQIDGVKCSNARKEASGLRAIFGLQVEVFGAVRSYDLYVQYRQ